MCCLKYEQVAYDDLLKTTPKQGNYVQTPEGKGSISEVSLLTGMLKVVLDKNANGAATVFHKDDVRVIKDGRGKADPPAPIRAKTPREEKTPK
jgi:cell fate regulator YaaT (PSP1 superfamily)